MHTFLFRFLPAFILCVSGQTWASNALCPAPVKALTELQQSKKAPTNEEYHDAMKASIVSGKHMDWVVDEEANACGGYYQVPQNPNPEKNVNPEEANMRISAESVDRAGNGYTVFSGDVEIYHGSRRFRCDSMSYSQSKNYAELHGNIQYREEGLLLSADTMQLFGDDDRLVMKDTQYLLVNENLRGNADIMNFDNSHTGMLNMQDTRFTACPPNNEHWAVAAKHLEIDKEKGWGTAKHAVFYVENIPVMYFPYLDFPIDDRRKTGLLFPTFSTVQGGGIDVTVPIYINLAPNYDMTYSPRYNGDHGILHGMQGRYLNNWSEWQVDTTYIDDDKLIGETSTGDVPDLDSSRLLAAVHEEGRFNKNWSTYIDYTAVSDIHYFRDWGDVGLDIQKTLNIKRQAQLNYRSSSWSVKTSLVDYQSLELDQSNKPYRHWPRVDVFHLGKIKNFHATALYTAQYTFFDHSNEIRAHRIYNAPGVTFPMAWQAYKLDPVIKIRRTDFDFTGSSDGSTTSPAVSSGHTSITAPMLKLDNRLFLERDYSFAGQTFTQTLTPRLYYLYSGFEEGQEDLLFFDTTENVFTYNQLFRESRFSGYDRIDDANQVTLALESEFLNGKNGNNILSVGIGQIIYFKDREVVLDAVDKEFLSIEADDSQAVKEIKQARNEIIDKKYYRAASDIAMTGRLTLSETESLIANFVIDPYNGDGEEASLIYHLQNKDGYIFNAGYRYKENLPIIEPGNEDSAFNADSEQIDLSVYAPIFRDWRFFARANYDIGKNERIDSITGLEYVGCCFNVTFAYQNERRTFNEGTTIPEYEDASYEHIWHIQFEFKGLGGINSSLTRILQEQIQGYQRSE